MEQHISGYFDHNATTPVSNEVIASMMPVMKLFANPSSNKQYAQATKKIVNDARSNVAQLLQVAAQNIFFTSGGSEANNWAIKGVLFKHIDSPGHIITSAIEHASVLDTIKYCAEKFSFDVTYLTPNSDGEIEVAQLQNAIREDTQLISIMYSNNETGVIQPIEKIAQLTREHNIPFHVDAVQFVGKKCLNVDLLGVDYLSLSAHKFYGPKGIGALYIKDSNSITPLIHGGGQELSMRSGTENIIAIAGIAKAADEAFQNIDAWEGSNWLCKQHLIKRLNACSLTIKFNGATEYERALPNTLNISIEGIRGEALALRMELLHGYILSVGSACSNNKTMNFSHVLKAMDLSESEIKSAIRISFGRFTTIKDIDDFVDALTTAVDQLNLFNEGA